jgi:alanyl-tRNA synthetase
LKDHGVDAESSLFLWIACVHHQYLDVNQKATTDPLLRVGLVISKAASRFEVSMTDKDSSESRLKWSANRIRSTFITFFEERNHQFVQSSSVVPRDDPALLFLKSGIHQFKNILLGDSNPKDLCSDSSRVVYSQRCVQAGGRLGDLDEIGKEPFQTTFFEILGTFSTHSKAEAIKLTFKLLTEKYELDPNRIHVL